MIVLPHPRREPVQGYWNYEIALYRGDTLIDSGTIREVAERRGVRKMTIYYYMMPVAGRKADTRKNKATGLRAVRI